MKFPIPVMMVTSVEGTNISRFVAQLVRSEDSERVQAIVPRKKGKRRHQTPDPGTIPVPEQLLRGRGRDGCGTGCFCCPVRGDLMTTVKQLVDDQSIDAIVIQTFPGSDLPSLVEDFIGEAGAGTAEAHGVQLTTVLNVVDGESLLSSIQGRGARALIERVEFANVVLVTGTNELEPENARKVSEVLEALNPEARIVYGDTNMPISALQTEDFFDLDAVQRRTSWRGDGIEAEAAPPMVRFNYQGKRPFHPDRLHELLGKPWPGVIRARGVFWIATYPEEVCVLDTAGPSRKTRVNGQWCVAVPGEKGQNATSADEYSEKSEERAIGERRCAISIMGVEVDESTLRSRFDACLLTDEEVANPERWQEFPHPFPWPGRNRW